MACKGWLSLVVFPGLALVSVQAAPSTQADEAALFDFEDGVGHWAPAALHDVKEADPPVRIEATDDGAASGKRALELTFAGGRWPCAGTEVIPVGGDFGEYQAIRAALTVDRPTVALFRVYQAKQIAEDGAAAPAPAHWERTMSLEPGRNDVVLNIRHGLSVLKPGNGEVVRFVIGAYRPAAGQVMAVDDVRLTRDGVPPELVHGFSPYSHDGYSSAGARAFERTGTLPKFKVAGTDLEVKDARDLGERLAGQWERPPENTLEEVEEAFRTKFEALRDEHPRAVLSVLRDGEKGYDPADPQKPYAGWRDAYITSHSPDGPYPPRESNVGTNDSTEAFMRHRSPLMRVDLSVIPPGAAVLAAQLVIPRQLAADLKAPAKPNVWVVEPCARAWDEYAVSGYWAANDAPWKAVNGIYYGPEPDFHNVFLAHGPGNVINVWDFTEAVRFWQARENHGFMLHGDSHDYMRIATREAEDIKRRPAVFVVWEPGE